mmetsp:Transcript_12426/g.13747  ORF Transcript_12426/g.13747 Transcript_12426/m.13747 type:complete len:409 (+) Transcript_12426:188-1414(+)
MAATSSPVSRKTSSLVVDNKDLAGLVEMLNIKMAENQQDPDKPLLADLLFGNPQELASDELVQTIQKAAVPKNPSWFAYKGPGTNEGREYIAKGLEETTGIPYKSDHILETTGAFTALQTCFATVLDPGDEVIYTTPTWFFYSTFAVAHDCKSVTVPLNLTNGDLDIDAIEKAMTSKTRLVLINTPKNPTGRIYTAEQLKRLSDILRKQSEKNGRTIYLISDEPYRKVLFKGKKFVPPSQFYDNTFISYSWGKQLLNPGQRLGYVAAHPKMLHVDEVLKGLYTNITVYNYAIPNAIMQYALPELDKLSVDIHAIEKRLKRVASVLRDLKWTFIEPEATFYIFIKSPIEDDKLFCQTLMKHNLLVLPGYTVGCCGWFRLSCTATDEMVEMAIKILKEAISDWETFSKKE